MAVKIRLMRIGAKKRPFYRVVVVDERKKRTGGYLELLGTYNPLTEPKEVLLKQDRIDEWLKKGAQPSDGFLRIIGKAPQKPPRKPKKEKKKEAPREEAEQPAPTETETEEKSEETQPEAERAKTDADSRLSEAGEARSQNHSTDVHEPDRADSDEKSEAELENQGTSSERSGDEIGALRPDEQSDQPEESTPIESESKA